MAYTSIDNPELFFQTKLYTGNGSAGHAITLDGDENMQPDFVWIKQRDSRDHFLFNSVTGATKYTASNETQVEQTDANTLTGFNSDGFTLGNGVGCNENNDTHVSWNWKAGTSFTNDASSTGIGSIDSAGSFNNDAGFSIVTYTGNGSSGATVKHGMNVAPDFMIIKSRDTTNQGAIVYTKALGATKFAGYLNVTDASGTATAFLNDTAPSSSVITLGTYGNLNYNGAGYVAYCFAEKKGYSKFGIYSGTDSTSGPFVYTGFKPAWLMIKRSGTANTSTNMNGSHWVMLDIKRDTINAAGAAHALVANLPAAEDTTNLTKVDFLSNGFKFRGGADAVNASDTYTYYAFAESPFVNSKGVPNNAR